MSFLPPTATNMAEWVRKASATINGLLRAPFQSSDSAPQNPIEGQGYYDLTTHKARIFDGTIWRDLW
jgi:hypothetical protein